MDGAGSAHRSSTEDVTSKIILTATIVLFVAVLVILLLHLYAKLYWWRVDDHQQQLPPPSSPPSVAIHQRRRFIFVSRQGGLCSTGGLTASDLSSLPIIVFRQDTYKEDGSECAVCLSVLVNGDKARLLPLCSHSFHVDCIDMWLQSHSTCPICRNTVLDPEKQACLKQVEPNPDIAAVLQSPISSSVSGSSLEPSNFPTNVLVWGSQDQISTAIDGIGSQEDSASNAAPRGQGAVVLEIDDSSSYANTSQNGPSLSSTSMGFNLEDEEAKSPMTTRLRSLKRFLSRDKRVACSGGSSSNAAASVDP